MSVCANKSSTVKLSELHSEDCGLIVSDGTSGSFNVKSKQDIPFDYTSNDPLVLTLTGSYLSPPVDWLSEGLSAEVDVKRNTSGVHTPIVS
jgi:hypothetical protein